MAGVVWFSFSVILFSIVVDTYARCVYIVYMSIYYIRIKYISAFSLYSLEARVR